MKALLKGQYVWLVNANNPAKHWRDKVREVTKRSVYLESSTRRFDPKTGEVKEGIDKLKFFDKEEDFKRFVEDAALQVKLERFLRDFTSVRSLTYEQKKAIWQIIKPGV